MHRITFLISILCILSIGSKDLYAQVPGEIIRPSGTASTNAILDPNGDGWITTSGAQFTGSNEVNEFELSFIGIAGPNEINGDAQEGGNCGNYDLVTGENQTGLYYHYVNPDETVNTTDDGVVFRVRSGDINTNDFSVHILIESNSNHAGFDMEVSVGKYNFFGFPVTVKNIFNLETGQETTLAQDVTQTSLANPNAGNCTVPAFTDLYFTLAELGINANQNIKITTVIARNRNNFTGALNVSSSIFDKDISDIYNYDDDNLTDLETALDESTSSFEYFTLAGEPPVINTTAASIDENVPAGTEVVTVDVTDPDSDSFLFKIIGGNTDGAFAIDNTGLITVANPAAIDFETNPFFDLVIEVKDKNGNKVEGTIRITVNNVNEPPSITGSDQSINENPNAGFLLTTLTITDPEDNVTSVEITNGNIDNAFAIDQNGNITVNNPSAINFEVNPVFDLEITVTDLRGLTASLTIKVTVIDINEAPTTENKTIVVEENTPVNTLVSTLTAFDEDGNFNRFEIIGGDGAPYFNISANGDLTVSDPSGLNYEINQQLILIVRVVDDLGLESEAQITIKITDIPEAPSISANDASIDENSPNGTAVVTAQISDPENNITSVEITSGNIDNAFVIDQNGNITVNNTAAINHEVNPEFQLELTVTDNSGLTASTTITITINDINEAPITQDATFEIEENTAINTLVSILEATDEDNNLDKFEIIGGDGQPYFKLSANGRLTVGDASVLDYETNKQFTIIVRVVDKKGLSSEAQITINITDKPEPPTIFAEDASVEENKPNGTVVTLANITDPENNILRAYISNAGTPFNIRNNGEIYVSDVNLLDYESQQTWTLNLEVLDNTNLKSSITITITVTDINEAPSAETLYYQVLGGETISDQILGNISDPENDQILLSEVSSESTALGNYTIDASSFSYTANNCSGGEDIINYTACDSKGLCSESVIVITVVVSDSDEDGIPDHIEIGADPNNPVDTDNDGTPDYLSTDSDGDEISDKEEAGNDPCNPADFNNNGIPDYQEKELVIKPLKPSKGFSPNGDGNNDFWEIEGIGEFPQNRIEVYNRWGNLVYQATGYNNQDVRWEGENTEMNVGGDGVPDGTYFYFLHVEESSKPLQGFLVLKR
ncbi:cadherin domain-containing protein [Marinigracilibium pacificum]|uniref:T9SS type B sorting domain-containing protein n=1 Tax=Marinigracilibium pacificum TaxID=2729599 RepID=A0A848J1F3_9BACT|nr:cadherin domain-containing protein [Marinigracilibium pacificum]NMM49178.1 T9SS type B sorting domain-containing protein [Marinigracilibium pacificum]